MVILLTLNALSLKFAVFINILQWSINQVVTLTRSLKTVGESSNKAHDACAQLSRVFGSSVPCH